MSAALAAKQATALGAAYAVPASEVQVIARLQTPEGGEFFVKTLDGGMLRVINADTGETHAFIVKREDDDVVFHQFLIERHPRGGGEVLTFLDCSLRASLSEKTGATGATATSLTTEGYSFELLGLENERAGILPIKPLLFPAAVPQKSICCVRCSGYTVCGCAVSACNKSCCSGSCCGDGGGPVSENR